ncbi:MAG: hypothetical protein KY475_00865 [Planctomycetes bacterium]|nr:hypothetical protein [Planctomycetota bacterium]
MWKRHARTISITLVAAGVAVAWGCAIAAHRSLGALAWGVYLGGLLALVGVFLASRREKSAAEVELEKLRKALDRDRGELDKRRREMQNFTDSAEAALEKQGQLIDRRERELAQKLIVFHEWLEFPQPVGKEASQSQEDVAELTKKDRQVLELLDRSAKQIYENIRNNKYSPTGEFEPKLVRREAEQIAIAVARVYRPGSENPLLETSIDQLLRAAGRTSLHLLVVLDRMPLGVKEYNFNSLYWYVRHATRAYGAYKTAEPYMPYFNGAYYLSRFAMGASPWTLAAWRLVSELSTRGAKKLATHWFNRHATSLVYDVVRVLGFEVAGIFGGDFRHRDAGWIYGAELTELISRFPLSRDALSHGLKEVGSLQVRNEYDRLFLYQCLAAHASAQPGRFQAALHLTPGERRAIAQRLEKFFRAFIHGKTDERTAAWRAEVEQRLVVKLDLEAHPVPTTLESQRRDAIRSLASFLLAVKEREPEELADLLGKTPLFREHPADDRKKLLEELQEAPPFFYEQPDLDPSSPLAKKYLDDLARLAVRVTPYDVPSDELLDDVAAYLRADAKEFQRNLDAQREELLQERSRRAPVGNLSPGAVKAILHDLEPEERLSFLYGDASLDWPRGAHTGPYSQGEMWLVGREARLALWHVADNGAAAVIWIGGRDVSFQRLRGYFSDDLLLRGGEWKIDFAPLPEAIRLSGQMGRRWEPHFHPLLDFCRQPG